MDYKIIPTRNPKQVGVRCLKTGGLFMSPTARLCNTVGSRWSGRYDAYVMSISNAALVQAAHASGWKGKLRVVNSAPAVFIDPDGKEHTPAAAKKILGELIKEILKQNGETNH